MPYNYYFATYRVNFKICSILFFNIFESLWIKLESLWRSFESLLTSLDNFWLTFESLRISFESILSHFKSIWTIFEFIWISLNHVWITFESLFLKEIQKLFFESSFNIFEYLWITLELLLKSLWIIGLQSSAAKKLIWHFWLRTTIERGLQSWKYGMSFKFSRQK